MTVRDLFVAWLTWTVMACTGTTPPPGLGPLVDASGPQAVDAAPGSTLDAASPPVDPGQDVGTFGLPIVGDGNALDGTNIQKVLDQHPGAHLHVPAGKYLLNNTGVTTFGLDFNGFTGTLTMAAGASFVCNDATRNSGQCLNIRNSHGATFQHLDVTYRDTTKLPLPRGACSAQNAILVEDSTAIAFTDLVIETSPGVGLWNTNSENVSVKVATVTSTSADGIHFENVMNASVDQYTSDGTGDDALAVTNIATSNPNCGFTATNIHVRNSLARGIVVVGGCDSTVRDFDIATTTDPGISVSQDTVISSRRSSNTTFSHGTITGSGQYCGEIAEADNTTFDSITCTGPANTGFFVYSNAKHVTISNSTVTDAGNNGFQTAGSSNVSFVGDTATSTLAAGFAVNTSTTVALTNVTTRNAHAQGFYHSDSSGVTETGLTVIDAAMTGGNNRAWWAENMTGAVTVTGLEVTDDQAAATGFVVGDANDGSNPINVSGLAFTLAHGASQIQPGGSSSHYSM